MGFEKQPKHSISGQAIFLRRARTGVFYKMYRVIGSHLRSLGFTGNKAGGTSGAFSSDTYQNSLLKVNNSSLLLFIHFFLNSKVV